MKTLSINTHINGFTLIHRNGDAIEPRWVYQGLSPETVDEMLAQARLILLKEPDEIPLPDLDATLEHPTTKRGFRDDP